MKLDLIPIGNSRGIRIPKGLLEQCGFEEAVEIQVEKNRLVLSPATQTRAGWDEAFKQMTAKQDDKLIETPAPEFDETEWRW